LDRSADWLGQSRHTLGSAKLLARGGFHDGACFQSQQAAEFAIKALYLSLKFEGWGHSLTSLLKEIEMSVKVPKAILRAAQRLDRHYIQTRYPNGFDRGSPKDYYTEEDSKEAIEHAEAIIRFCEANLPQKG